MALMVEAGFTRVFVGIETPDETCLAECRELQNRSRDLLGDVKLIQQTGLEVQGGFIVGFDHDLPSIFQRQIDFIQKSGIVTATVGLLQVILGTWLYERMQQEGRIRGDSHGDNADGTTNILPVTDLETLREDHRRILRHICSPEHFYQRAMVCLRNSRPPTGKSVLRFPDVHAFIQASWRLGILERERFRYWRLLDPPRKGFPRQSEQSSVISHQLSVSEGCK